MLCPIKVNRNTTGLKVHTSCYCIYTIYLYSVLLRGSISVFGNTGLEPKPFGL